MEKIGICFGGYCPLHRGHLDAIMMAKKENDKCYVVVCGYDNEPRGEEISLNLDKRYQLVKEFFKGDEIIEVIKVNDTELGIDESMSQHNWRVWFDAVRKQTSLRPHLGPNPTPIEMLSFYVAEERYVNDLELLFKDNWHYEFAKNISVHLIPKELPISGTKIRENPIKYWQYITKPFQKFFTKNILIIGTASEGKTTLVRDIAKYFDIPHIEEYGRTYMEEKNMLDTDLTCHDFTEFLFNQRSQLIEAEGSYANNKGIIISDTDNLITLMYAKAYTTEINPRLTNEEFESLKDLVKKHLTKGVYWDKIYIIPPGNKFVDDGSRFMEQASLNERKKNYKILKELIHEIAPFYEEKMQILYSGRYYTNFNIVKEYINNLLR